MKEMRPILMDENAIFIPPIIAVATHRPPSLHDENLFARCSQSLRQNSSRKPGTDDQSIKKQTCFPSPCIINLSDETAS